MEIRDQMTATVRFTKQAAQRFNSFLSGLNNEPKNMNDALNLALSDLPLSSSIDDFTRLEEDRKKSIMNIDVKFTSTRFLTRTEYYFLVMIAKNAVVLNKKQRVKHASIRSALEMTLDLWDLCEQFDPGGHTERYLLGNIGGNRMNGEHSSLGNHIPSYIEQSKRHPFPATLEFALRNPEVMLRDQLIKLDDVVINAKMQKHYKFLRQMAIRWYYLEHKTSLFSEEKDGPFGSTFSGTFGKERRLYVSQYRDKNIGFILSALELVTLNLAANDIVEVEEYICAFLEEEVNEPDYKGEIFSIMKAPKHSGVSGYMIQNSRFQLWITYAEFQMAAEALSAMLADSKAQTALNEAWERYGEI